MPSTLFNTSDGLADLTQDAYEVRGKLRPREKEEEAQLISREAGGRFSVQADWPQVCAKAGPRGAFTELWRL